MGSHVAPRTDRTLTPPVTVAVTVLVAAVGTVVATPVRSWAEAGPMRLPLCAMLPLGPAMTVAIALSLPAVNAHTHSSPLGDKLGFKIA